MGEPQLRDTSSSAATENVSPNHGFDMGVVCALSTVPDWQLVSCGINEVLTMHSVCKSALAIVHLTCDAAAGSAGGRAGVVRGAQGPVPVCGPPASASVGVGCHRPCQARRLHSELPGRLGCARGANQAAQAAERSGFSAVSEHEL